ncbi:hypothetical protein FB45DRAFT_865797 [Roridomyces roridus]|uniref:Uncharacterized protein n=1 Tax=Roridomyces roridus TaxID=1738132 RepID=A0AAD7FSR1_9AGAR|nr:hypothetical protein FB45DRAFT_865797 [Roridomyces roridus]
MGVEQWSVQSKPACRAVNGTGIRSELSSIFGGDRSDEIGQNCDFSLHYGRAPTILFLFAKCFQLPEFFDFAGQLDCGLPARFCHTLSDSAIPPAILPTTLPRGMSTVTVGSRMTAVRTRTSGLSFDGTGTGGKNAVYTQGSLELYSRVYSLVRQLREQHQVSSTDGVMLSDTSALIPLVPVICDAHCPSNHQKHNLSDDINLLPSVNG